MHIDTNNGNNIPLDPDLNSDSNIDSTLNMIIEIFSPSWKINRREITVFYGYVTFIITIIFLLILPKWNRISNYIYYKFLKFNKWIKQNPETQLLRWNPMSTQMIIFWSIILSILSIAQTNGDIRFIAARLGRVPVYCLPTVLILTLRPSPLPDVLYLSLLPIHKWLSRLVVLQSLLHTLLYIYIMSKNETLFKLHRFDNLNGIIAMTAFIIIVLTSLPYIRRTFYKIFFINHYICTWIVTLTLYLHVRPGIPYLTTLNCLILLYQIYYKFKISTVSTISTIKISKNMIILDLPNDSLVEKNTLPGCHLRIIDYNDKLPKFLNYLWYLIFPIQHPYTLATLSVDKSQKLIIRVGNYKFKNNSKYLITGSYMPHLSFIKKISHNNNNGNHLSMSNLLNSNNPLSVNTKVKKCLIVVGGSAISFALPILRVLNYNGSMVKIIWVIRDHDDLKILDYFKKYLVNDDCIDIFITGHYTISEKANFRDALNELHSRKRELELKHEMEILSGNFSYNNNNHSDDKDSFDVSSSNNSLSPTTTFKFNSASTDESTPLNNSKNMNVTYGSSTLDDSKLYPKHKKSLVQLRDSGKASSNSYYTETIDIELHEDEIYKKSHPTIPKQNASGPSAGVETHYGNNDIVFDENQNPVPIISRSPRHTVSEPQNLNVTIIEPDIQPKSAPLRTQSKKLSGLSTINQKLLGSYAPTIASSALYDDLEDYWVLKNSNSRIEFGRPVLGLYYYSWCIGSSCKCPLITLKSGETISYLVDDGQVTELYSDDTFIANREARFQNNNGEPDEEIYVIGAGPSGLVDNVRLWANDCGFSFHEESFIV